ncbi:hypothetical protein [Micromonospora sp. 4G55]|uniref:hypothetical protein n=1 Tax=Micromonospora sp. 4G55 TaxID=2806102 RepID=UPI001A4A9E76|nr:hypothetical protein [Micromonospora sp. 4G55]MBM0258299.1 hypothetical protein [Micromonospora sp. 4G55]
MAAEGTPARDGHATPGGWAGGRLSRSALPGLALFVVLAVCGLAALAGGVIGRDPVLVVGGAVLLPLFGSLIGLLLVASSRGSGAATTLVPWPGGGTRAVRFGYRAAAYGWFGAVTAACALFALGMAVGAATVWGGVLGWVSAAVLAGGAALLGWHLVVMLRLAPGGLLLSPAGIAHAGLTSFYSVPWAAVHAVAATSLRTSVLVVKAEPAPASVLRRHTGRFDTGELQFLPFLVVRTYWLAADREVVRQAVAFYLAHPELRDELATPAAVRRIVEGRTRA